MIRKLLFAACAILSANMLSAQISLDKEDDVMVTLSPSDFDATLSVTVLNNSQTETASVDAEREEISTVLGSSNYFCFGVNCYPASTDKSTNPQPIEPGASDKTFKAYYEPKGNEGETEVRYCFTDNNGAGTPQCLNIIFAASQGGSSIGEHIRDVNLNASFNKNNERITLVYANLSGAGSVEIRDITGKVVQGTKVQFGNGVVIVPANGLSNGLHIVSLKDANNNVLAVQKLSVY